MNEPTGYAAVLIALVTAGVTLWTQRGSARAQRQAAEIEQRAQDLEEFKVLRSAALEDVSTLRAEVASLRTEVQTARMEAREQRAVLHVATVHIDELRRMVPTPPGPPTLPDVLRDRQ